MNLSQRTTVLIIYVINILFALTSILYVLGDSKAAIIIYAILLAILIWFVFHTNIITDKRPPKLKDIVKKKINGN